MLILGRCAMPTRALIGKEQGFEIRDSDIWADTFEHLESSDSPKLFEPTEEAHSALLKTSTIPFLLEEGAEASALYKCVLLPSRSALMSPLLAARRIKRIKLQHWGSAGPTRGGKVLCLEGTARSSQQILAGSGSLFKGLGSESTGSRWVEYPI